MLRQDLKIRDKEKEKSERTNESNNKENNTKENIRIKFRVRFDYRGKPKPARFFFGGRKTEDVAQEIREQQVALWRNLPLQGIHVEGIDPGEIYSLYDEELDDEVSFAPLELVINADSIEDLLRFILREEFRRIEILEPSTLVLNNKEMEKMLFRINEIMRKKMTPAGKTR